MTWCSTASSWAAGSIRIHQQRRAASRCLTRWAFHKARSTGGSAFWLMPSGTARRRTAGSPLAWTGWSMLLLRRAVAARGHRLSQAARRFVSAVRRTGGCRPEPACDARPDRRGREPGRRQSQTPAVDAFAAGRAGAAQSRRTPGEHGAAGWPTWSRFASRLERMAQADVPPAPSASSMFCGLTRRFPA